MLLIVYSIMLNTWKRFTITTKHMQMNPEPFYNFAGIKNFRLTVGLRSCIDHGTTNKPFWSAWRWFSDCWYLWMRQGFLKVVYRFCSSVLNRVPIFHEVLIRCKIVVKKSHTIWEFICTMAKTLLLTALPVTIWRNMPFCKFGDGVPWTRDKWEFILSRKKA